jgi:hypothetical protein
MLKRYWVELGRGHVSHPFSQRPASVPEVVAQRDGYTPQPRVPLTRTKP